MDINDIQVIDARCRKYGNRFREELSRLPYPRIIIDMKGEWVQFAVSQKNAEKAVAFLSPFIDDGGTKFYSEPATKYVSELLEDLQEEVREKISRLVG